MTKLKYNDINTNRGIFPDITGVFSLKKNGNLPFFSFLKLENIQIIQTLFKCSN